MTPILILGMVLAALVLLAPAISTQHKFGKNNEAQLEENEGFRTTAGAGAVPTALASYVTAIERGNGVVHQTILTMTALPVTLTDDAGNGQYVATKLYDFPQGLLHLLGAVLDADIVLLTPFIDAAEGDVGVGTAAIPDAADAIGTVAAEDDIIPTTAIAAMTAKAGPIDAMSADAENVQSDGTATAKDLYLNLMIDDNVAHTTKAGNLITGTLTFTWINLGDV